MPVEAVLAFAVIIAALLAIAQWVLPRVLTYRIDGDAVRVRFLLVPILRLRYVDIIGIEVISSWKIWFPRSLESFNAVRAGNRAFARDCVLIRRRTGLRKAVILTPDEPAAFVADVQRRLGQGHGGRVDDAQTLGATDEGAAR